MRRSSVRPPGKSSSYSLFCNSHSLFDVAGRVPDAELGEVTVQRFFSDSTPRIGERRFGRRDVERGRLLGPIQLERLRILRLGGRELVAGEAETGLGGVEIDEGFADVLARQNLRVLEAELCFFLFCFR